MGLINKWSERSIIQKSADEKTALPKNANIKGKTKTITLVGHNATPKKDMSVGKGFVGEGW